MSKHILVTYATRAGSTVGVADAISEVLTVRGFTVDVKPVKENPPVNDYDAVVLGSAIRMGAWLSEMMEFIKRNQAKLDQVPVAIFTVHMLNGGDDETSRAARATYTTTVHQLIDPVDEVFFSGVMEYSKLSFLDRTIAKAVEKKTGTLVGDFRDWDKIRSWAKSILSKGGSDETKFCS